MSNTHRSTMMMNKSEYCIYRNRSLLLFGWGGFFCAVGAESYNDDKFFNNVYSLTIYFINDNTI